MLAALADVAMMSLLNLVVDFLLPGFAACAPHALKRNVIFKGSAARLKAVLFQPSNGA
jgi:hypothetical protein